MIKVVIFFMYRLLQCFAPYFIGDGVKCTIDEDGDGYPNVPLDLCADMNITNTPYCTAVRPNDHVT